MHGRLLGGNRSCGTSHLPAWLAMSQARTQQRRRPGLLRASPSSLPPSSALCPPWPPAHLPHLTQPSSWKGRPRASVFAGSGEGVWAGTGGLPALPARSDVFHLRGRGAPRTSIWGIKHWRLSRLCIGWSWAPYLLQHTRQQVCFLRNVETLRSDISSASLAGGAAGGLGVGPSSRCLFWAHSVPWGRAGEGFETGWIPNVWDTRASARPPEDRAGPQTRAPLFSHPSLQAGLQAPAHCLLMRTLGVWGVHPLLGMRKLKVTVIESSRSEG